MVGGRIMALCVAGVVTLCVGTAAVVTAEPFVVGEKLQYRIFWGPLPIGEASLQVRGVENVQGHPCYHLIAQAQTTGLGRMLFPVNSVSESWLDVEGLFSRQYREERREGRRHRHTEIVFDYTAGVATIRNLRNGKSRQTPLAQPTQDIISSLYYVRAQSLDLNKELTFDLVAGDEIWKVTLRPDARQKVEVRPFGRVPALRVEPHPTLTIVAANKGRMWFWISDDARRVPLMVCSQMQIGSAQLVLYRLEPPADREERAALQVARAAHP
ncbi:MAG: DUF3108 domain-containing protein [Verrucomicrobiae bacterium]|nr:DUF3108 domain-containing protein [Verrucomicrobiae bacterium]MDW8344834.1 DUF3108 domain-containing protein [Verrucomicrobiae bacterium]